MTSYELFQLTHYGNILPSTPEHEPQEDNRLLEQLELKAELESLQQ